MKNRIIAVCSAVLVVLALGVMAQAQAPAKVAGAWVMSFQGRGGTVMSTLTLTQDGGALKGSMKAADGTETQLDSGTVSGNDITFSVTRTGRDGNPQKIEYKGTVAGDAITGTFQRGQNSVDWTAKRQ
jgi:hypothetical protein